MKTIPKEAIELTIATLQALPRLHWKSCFEDISGRPEYHCNCPMQQIIEELADYQLEVLDKEKAKKLWKELGDIPINDNEEIEENFLHFPKGTNRYVIWHWFVKRFNLSIAEDLMYQE